MTTIAKLEALLARIQRNRAQPRGPRSEASAGALTSRESDRDTSKFKAVPPSTGRSLRPSDGPSITIEEDSDGIDMDGDETSGLHSVPEGLGKNDEGSGPKLIIDDSSDDRDGERSDTLRAPAEHDRFVETQGVVTRTRIARTVSAHPAATDLFGDALRRTLSLRLRR